MPLFTAAVHPGKAVGFLVLGASLHDILTRLKTEPQSFPKLDLIYSPTQPVTEPVILNLPGNGLRLRFDGPSQRLRLIEVLDFSRSNLSYNNKDVCKGDTSTGPQFRYIYSHLFTQSYEGEYVPPEPNDKTGYGLYVLSYPGIAISFPVLNTAAKGYKDYVELLSSSATLPAASMAIFFGQSWPDVRSNLFTMELPDPKILQPGPRQKETYADDIGMVKLLGAGRLEMLRPWAGSSLPLKLGQTTPQELVAELGPPDAIYRKNDTSMTIHKLRTESESRMRPDMSDSRFQDDSTDTDQSSSHTATDISGDDSDHESTPKDISGECFYNYFYHGFDILISAPTASSRAPPSQISVDADKESVLINTSTPLVATKIILHSNVPGSYSFNRHRRSQWEITYLDSTSTKNAKGTIPGTINSETPFPKIAAALNSEWSSIYASPSEAAARQRGMVLNRGWGDSPGSSIEMLGGWEDSAGGRREGSGEKRSGSAGIEADQGLGNTTLYGFPGLVFEVLKNGIVAGVTVF